MDHGQSECGIFRLFADRRQDAYLAVPDLKNGVVGIAFVVLDLDPMQTLDRNLVHFVGNCMIAVPGKPINTGSHQKMRSNLLGQAKQLIDVTLAITNMNASFRGSEKVGRLP
ncbi:hypothetical protein [Bradyrhizobium sp. USDA 4452]